MDLSGVSIRQSVKHSGDLYLFNCDLNQMMIKVRHFKGDQYLCYHLFFIFIFLINLYDFVQIFFSLENISTFKEGKEFLLSLTVKN